MHHVTHWADGGATDPENLALLCPAHHAKVHEGEISLTGRAPDELVFRTPAGYPIARRQPPPVLPEDPVATLVARHENDGLDINPETNAIDWWGERLDAYWAVTTLMSHDRQAVGAESGT